MGPSTRTRNAPRTDPSAGTDRTGSRNSGRPVATDRNRAETLHRNVPTTTAVRASGCTRTRRSHRSRQRGRRRVVARVRRGRYCAGTVGPRVETMHGPAPSRRTTEGRGREEGGVPARRRRETSTQSRQGVDGRDEWRHTIVSLLGTVCLAVPGGGVCGVKPFLHSLNNSEFFMFPYQGELDSPKVEISYRDHNAPPRREFLRLRNQNHGRCNF